VTTVWLNGGVVAAEDAHIDIADRGFLLADGLFETMLAKSGSIERLDAHLARLIDGAKVLGIPVPLAAATLAEACGAVLAANGLESVVRAGLRLTLTRGPGPRGVLPPKEPRPTVLITAAAASSPPASTTAITARTVRRDATSPLSHIKSLAYTGNILARIEADAAGASEALILNTDGNLAETTSSNVFLVEDGTLVTPPVSDGVLPGIARAAVIESAKGLGITIWEESISVERLRNASEIFLTNSLIGVCPLAILDGRVLSPGDVTARFRQTLDS
jgi:branched-chain amino acid aminotransferase